MDSAASFLKVAEKAKSVLAKCSTKNGMYASAWPKGYNMVFSRDSMISLIGGSSFDKAHEFKDQFRITLETLSKYQSESGQIPNAVDKWDSARHKQVTFATIDSTLWFLLGLKAYRNVYKDKKFFNEQKETVKKAFYWIRCMDTGEDRLPEQLPTSDWEDCFPHKYGHTINTIALYYACLKAYGKPSLAKKVQDITSGGGLGGQHIFDYDLGYFLPWRWKDHNGIIEHENWFDSFGNMLAICSGLANKNQAESIMNFIDKKRINRPFPVRVIYPPIEKDDKEWHYYFSKSGAGKPNSYLNGGIWPYIGGFYVAGLVKMGKIRKAEQEMKKLVLANKLGRFGEWEFNEWISPETKKAKGSPLQAWSAGAFIFAYASLIDKSLPLFG